MAHRPRDDRGPLRFGDGPSPYRWSAIASAALFLAALALAIGGPGRLGTFLLGVSLVPFSAVNALNLRGAAHFHVAYANGQWWAFRYWPGAPMWLMRAGAAVLAATGMIVALWSTS